jgi:hypothetical protein
MARRNIDRYYYNLSIYRARLVDQCLSVALAQSSESDRQLSSAFEEVYGQRPDSPALTDEIPSRLSKILVETFSSETPIQGYDPQHLSRGMR